MDAKEFMIERQRMCSSYHHACDRCPAYMIDCSFAVSGDGINDLVNVVERWSKDHPRKTNFNKLSDVVQGLFKGVKMTATNDWDGNVGTVYIEAGAGYWDMAYKEEDDG